MTGKDNWRRADRATNGNLVFAFPGIGSFLANAIFNLDYAVLQGFILIIAVVYALVNLVVDVSYGFIDPRTRATR